MRTAYLAVLAILIISLAIAAYAYPQVPDNVPSHWNAAGDVDGYMDRFWGLFLFPIILIPLILLFIAIPRIDPLKKNVAKFRAYFDGFIVIFAVFMFYVQLLTTAWALGYTFNMMVALMPAFAMLFFYCGILMEKSKRNWFIGIRTPWTLSSDRVWEKTHRLGGKMFKAAAVISLLGIAAGEYAIWVLLVPVLVAAFYPMVYSYFEYQKIKKKR
ncbi:MAG: SdpI family protein [Candidatus Aenigmarchaeota archaeon]